jgi:methyltransferase (TIGR00027 family)
MATALMRALHTRADVSPLIHDTWGETWLAPARQRMEALAKSAGLEGIDAFLRSGPAYAIVIARTRFTEDALFRAREKGVGQYVIVGAGFDSFALRHGRDAEDLVVFEVDHPATQTFKRDRLAATNTSPPKNLHFVPADLAAERLGDVLQLAGFKAEAPAFFAWLGVTIYLTREANLATLKEIARIGARGSELVFTYSDSHALHAQAPNPSSGLQEMREMVNWVGEPYLSGFDPAGMADELLACGLDLIEDFSADELVARYDPHGANGLKAEPFSRVARAVVR